MRERARGWESERVRERESKSAVEDGKSHFVSSLLV